MRTKKLTARRQQILDFIVDHIEENGYPPTVREIGEHVGLSSSSSVHFHLKALEESGHLQRDGSLTRAIRPSVAATSHAEDISPEAAIPLVGQVAAGEPILAAENVEELMPMPETLFPERDLFMLRVKGDSMINVGILDGDYVIVQCQGSADNGDIVVALLDDEATVKRFFRRDNYIELRPENDAMDSFRVSDVQILGRVRGVLRKLK